MNEIQTRFENLARYVSSANATDRDRRAWASALDNATASEREGLARYFEWADVVVSSYGCALDAEEPNEVEPVHSLPRTETFTDAAGRPAVRYLDDDEALGIAAGSELLAAPANPCCGCCVAAAERGELDHVPGPACPVGTGPCSCGFPVDWSHVTEDTEPRCPATFGSTGEEDDRCVLAENHEPPRHETATGVEWGPWIHRDIDRTRSVTYTAANGHRMSYYARASDPTRAAFGAGSGAWCAEGCPACAAGEALPDW